MLNIREKVFFVSGSDFFQRQLAVGNIKKRISKNSHELLSSSIFYGKETELVSLQEKLLTASFGKNKVIIFKDFLGLNIAIRNFIFVNLEKVLSVNYIIFETDKDYYQLQRNKKITSDKLFNLILTKSSLIKVTSLKRKVSMNDFIDALRRKDLSSSLYILESLFESGSKDKMFGVQVIGILVRNSSYLKDSFKKDKSFKYLWEADRAIKEKGVDVRLAIQTLLVKLAGLH
jgi:DNA polymerase III delta subunit